MFFSVWNERELFVCLQTKRRDQRMEQLDTEKLKLEEKLMSLYEMETKMRSHIEQFSPSLLPSVPPTGRNLSTIKVGIGDKYDFVLIRYCRVIFNHLKWPNVSFFRWIT